MITIRQEKSEDIPFVYSVIEQAFNRDAEAKLADKLRQACAGHLSLVADDDGVIVGHIMFSPVLLKNDKDIKGMGLAPMAVQPARQCQGLGTQLVRSGLEILKERGCPFVIVLGHPDYYPRFGFQPASRYSIRSQWEGVPDEAFMLLVFDDNAMLNISGTVIFRDEFNEAL